MKALFIEQEFKYDGTQLVSLHNYLKYKILGDSIVSWIGPCDISFEHMMDGEDLLAQAEIRGGQMLHFIIEKFDCTLFAAVALQRLLTAMVKDHIQRLAPAKSAGLFRDGDDLYLSDRKLSISIATQTPVSSLIHFAVNCINEGTPVKTLSLNDLGIPPKVLATEVMATFAGEIRTIQQATQKVRWAK